MGLLVDIGLDTLELISKLRYSNCELLDLMLLGAYMLADGSLVFSTFSFHAMGTIRNADTSTSSSPFRVWSCDESLSNRYFERVHIQRFLLLSIEGGSKFNKDCS